MLKLINNCARRRQRGGAGRGAAAGEGDGRRPRRLRRGRLGAGSGASAQLTLKSGPMREHDYTTLFKTAHMLKDVRLCLEEARGGGGPFPAAGARARLLAATMGARPRRAGLRGADRGRRGPRRRGVAVSDGARPCRDWPVTGQCSTRKKAVDLQGIWDFRSGFGIFNATDALVPPGDGTPSRLSVLVRSRFVSFYANCFQRMGGHRPRARRRRAAPHAAQGRHPRGRQALPARARALLPVPDVRPPAQRPRARVPPARAAPRAGGGRLERRRAAPAHVRVRRRRCSSPTACASAPGRKSPITSRSPTRAAWTRSRRSTCGRPTTPRSAWAGAAPAAARAAAAHLPHPAPGHGQGQGRVPGPVRRGSSCSANFRSRAPRCSPTTSSSAPPRRSGRSRAKQPASRSSSSRVAGRRRPASALGAGRSPLRQRFAQRPRAPGLRHEHVARTGRQEVGDVEAARRGAAGWGCPPRAAGPG